MKIRVLHLAGLALLCGGLVEAGLVTFTNRAEWERATRVDYLVDFNAFNAINFSSTPQDFGPLTLAQRGVGQTDGNFITGGSDIGFFQTPSAKLFVDSNIGVDLFPHSPISAWGADFGNFSDMSDQGRVFINLKPSTGEASVPLEIPRTSTRGFFGFVDNSMLYNSCNFSAIADPTFQMDDVAATSSVVPEPATLCLFGLGILGMAGCYGWRRKEQPVADQKQP